MLFMYFSQYCKTFKLTKAYTYLYIKNLSEAVYCDVTKCNIKFDS